MALPTRSRGYKVKADDWNAHVDAINSNTSDVGSLDTRVTGNDSAISSNDTAISDLNTAVGMPYGGADNLETRVTDLENNSSSGDHYNPTSNDDTALYGDVVSSSPRKVAWSSITASDGYFTASASISAKTFTASELRFCIVSTGDYSDFDIGFYIGSSLSNLNRHKVWSGGEQYTNNSTGVKYLSFSSVQINAGDYIALAFVGTGSSNVAEFSMTPGANGADILMSGGGNVYAGYNSTNTYTPSSIDMTTLTPALHQAWFAIA